MTPLTIPLNEGCTPPALILFGLALTIAWTYLPRR